MGRCKFLVSIKEAFAAVFSPKPCNKPLEPYRQSLILLCAHPPDESSDKRQKIVRITFTVIVLTVKTSIFIGCLIYCYEFFSIDFKRCVLAFMGAGTTFSTIYMTIVAITQRYKVAAIFEDLSTIYNSYENDQSFRFLIRANSMCTWIGSIYVKLTIGSVVGVTMTCFISVVYCWLMNDHLNVKDCYHILPVVLPWDQTTLLGYFMEVALFIPYGSFIMSILGLFLMLFISMSIHHQAFYKMFKQSVDKMNQSDKIKRSGPKLDEKFLQDLIRFHIPIKNWFLDTAQFYSPIVMIQIICCVILMAVSMFNLDMQSQHIDFDMSLLIVSCSLGLLNALLYCYFGKLATESFEKMHDCLFELDWCELPISTQKYFIIIAANVQGPLHYHGFNVLYLKLETFTRLIKSVFSYYSAIKTITLN